MSEINYNGLAELGWTASQWINGKNGYKHWDQLTSAEQAELRREWAAKSPEEKAYLRDIVVAAIDAYQSAVLV
jgi:hypothetical protein